MRILLDNGHGSNTPGKCSPDKRLYEYSYCREIVNMISSELRLKGYAVDIITPEKNDISLTTRVGRVNNICKKYGASNCILISVHINASASDNKWHNASGWTGWIYTGASSKSKKLAQLLYKQAKVLGLQGNRWVPDCEYWTANYYICKKTNCATVLTENMFQDNKNDVDFLLSDEGKRKIVDLHVNGIIEYIKSL